MSTGPHFPDPSRATLNPVDAPHLAPMREVSPVQPVALPPLALGVLVSGSGSNFQAILDAIHQGRLHASVKVLISNRADAYALERARRAGIPAQVVAQRQFSSRRDFEQALLDILQAHGVECVALAGFMRVLTGHFLSAFPGRVVNIHPALLPAFPGLHGPRQALAYGARVAGATVHLVDEGVDTGPILAQGVVPVLDDDTEETLAARILTVEHQLYPHVLQLIAERRFRVEGRRVRILDAAQHETMAAPDTEDSSQRASAESIKVSSEGVSSEERISRLS